jgi:hypothetical protein
VIFLIGIFQNILAAFVFERIQCLEQRLNERHSQPEFKFSIPGLKDLNSVIHADDYNQIFQILKGKYSGIVERNI